MDLRLHPLLLLATCVVLPSCNLNPQPELPGQLAGPSGTAPVMPSEPGRGANSGGEAPGLSEGVDTSGAAGAGSANPEAPNEDGGSAEPDSGLVPEEPDAK